MKLPLGILGLLLFQISLGQNTVFNYQPVEATAVKPTPYTSYIITDVDSKKSTVLVRNNNQVEYLLLSGNFTLEEKLQVPLANTIFNVNDYLYLAGVHNNLGSCFIWSVKDKSLNDNKWHLRMEVADFKNKKLINKQLFMIPEDEHTVDWYTAGGMFTLITSNDRTKQLLFHVLDKDGKLTTKTMDADLKDLMGKKALMQDYFLYSHTFKANEQVELPGANDPTKLFIYPDRIVMLIANLNEPPHIWDIDTKTYTAKIRKLDMPGFTGYDGKKGKAYTTSYLYNDKIFVMNASKDNLEVGVFDLPSGKLLKKYDIDNSTPFLEPPVEKKFIGRMKQTKDLSKDKSIYKELSRGSGSVAIAVDDKGQIIVTCGVYDKEQRQHAATSTGHTVLTQQSMPTGQTYASTNIPVMSTYTSYTTSRSYNTGSTFTYIRTASFKLLLDPSGFDIVKTSAGESQLDKINNFIETIEDKSEAQNIFSIGSKTYIGYYDKAAKTFFIKEIIL